MNTERTYRALIIGNSEFPHSDGELETLYGPRNDVATIKTALCHPEWGLHYEENVISLIDGAKAEIEGAMEAFFRDASKDDQLFFLYSGHGLQELDGRLYLSAADTHPDRPLSSAIAYSSLEVLAQSTKAAASVLLLDCCYSGSLKGREPEWATSGRGVWSIASSGRDQGTRDGKTPSSPSPFSELVAETLVANAEVDLDGDGFVTVEDLKRVVGPELSSRTGQNLTCRFDGSGDLAIALAPNHPVDFTKDDWQYVAKNESVVPVPPIPAPTPSVVRDEVLEEAKAATPPRESGVQSISWQLPLDEFQQEVLSALDSGRDVPLKLTVQNAQKEARRLLESSNGWEDLGSVLDRVAVMATTFITVEREEWFTRSMALMNKMYELGFDKNGYTRRSVPAAGGLNSAEYWYGLLQRIMSVGSFAVRSESWSSVRGLILQRPVGYEFRHYNNWIRHAVTESARAGLFRREVDGKFIDVSLIEITRDFVSVHDALRPDLDAGDQEALTNSICQFDAFACIVALAAASSDEQRDTHGSQFYPNFARFYTQRSEPAFRLLLENTDARRILAPVEDADLATIYKTISRSAAGESFRFNGWDEFEDTKIQDFLLRYP